MNLTLIKLGSALIVFLLTVFCGSLTLWRRFSKQQRDTPHLAEGFAGGIFLGVGLFHMLPDSWQTLSPFYHRISLVFILVIALFTFMIFALIDKVATLKADIKLLAALLLTLIISIHSFILGLTLGLNQTFISGLCILIAILAHKGSEAFAISVKLYKYHYHQLITWLLFLIYALMTPAGILLGLHLTHTLSWRTDQLAYGFFAAFALGIFAHMAIIHGCRHSNVAKTPVYLSYIIGFLLMFFLAFIR